jgi:putative aldouronate transport system substrate-binding protein
MLRAFRDIDVNNVGIENVVPFAAAFEFGNPEHYILNSLGFVTRSRSWWPALLDDEPVLPVNTELFRESLRAMNTMYEEGLLYSNFFTAGADGTAVNAILLAGRAGVYLQPVFVTGYEEWRYWEGLHPLTSQFNDTRQWPFYNAVSVGNFVISSNNRHPELSMRFADNYFGYDARFLWVGPLNGSPEAFGVPGVRWNEETMTEDFVEEEFPEGIGDIWTYLMMMQGPMPQFGATDLPENMAGYRERWLAAPPQSLARYFNLENPDRQHRESMYRNSVPYFTRGFPNVFYLDEETTIRMTDLRAVIRPFVDEQTALFITGRRSLDEFDNFAAELRAIGIEEYEAIYKQVWEDFLRATQ